MTSQTGSFNNPLHYCIITTVCLQLCTTVITVNSEHECCLIERMRMNQENPISESVKRERERRLIFFRSEMGSSWVPEGSRVVLISREAQVSAKALQSSLDQIRIHGPQTTEFHYMLPLQHWFLNPYEGCY